MSHSSKSKSFCLPAVSHPDAKAFITMLAYHLSEKAKSVLLTDVEVILHSIQVTHFAESDDFTKLAKVGSNIQNSLVVDDNFTIDAGQSFFDVIYSDGGKHLFNKAVVDCIGDIAKKASVSTNSVCTLYDDFGKDYYKLTVLREQGNVVPARSTMIAWLTGNHTTCRLIVLEGLPFLLNCNGFLRQFLPGLDTIVKLTVAFGMRNSHGEPEKPMAYIGPMLQQFLVHDSEAKLLTALLKSVSLTGSGTIPDSLLGSTQTGVVSGGVVGGGVSGGVAGGISGGVDGGAGSMSGGVAGGMNHSGTIYHNCTIGSPIPKKAEEVFPAPSAMTTPRRLVPSGLGTETTVGTFVKSTWNPQFKRWKSEENRFTIDMISKDGKKFLAILDGSVADPEQGNIILFEIESSTFKFDLKTHGARGQYIEIGRHASLNGELVPHRCILDSGKVQQLYDAFEEFKKASFLDYDPPSPSLDEDFAAPSDSEE